MEERLQKWIARCGISSRRAAEELLRQGRVTLNGRVAGLGESGDPERDTLLVDGRPVAAAPEPVYLMLNKPGGYECSHQPKHHASVYALLPPPLNGRQVQSLGRLDEDTTGLLLFSDDGQFIHRIISGKRKVQKTYRVTAKHDISDEGLRTLLSGVQLDDEPGLVAAVACERLTDREFLMTVTEGRYHQVKRMVAATSNRVEALKRVAIGGLKLPPDLPEGCWRWLTVADHAALEQVAPSSA